MDWIKKNILFVVGLAVAAGLLVASAVYLAQAQDAKSAANEELESKNRQLAELVARDPYPNKENIALAKAEQERISKFITEARSRFALLEDGVNLDNASFKSLLENTISTLEREAQRSGVKLPSEKYSFTFGDQRKQLQLPSASLGPFARELGDISDLCHVLFAAKIHSLVSLKRPSVATNEGIGNADILSKKPGTNSIAGALIYPYEISFQCFSSELGAVLEGFLKAPKSYVLKTVNVERGDSESSLSPVLGQSPGIGGMGMDPTMASRYGMGRYGNRYAPQAPAQQTQPIIKPNEPVLDEKPLRITIGLEIIKLGKSVAQAKTAVQ
jgi:hypothetical protein